VKERPDGPGASCRGDTAANGAASGRLDEKRKFNGASTPASGSVEARRSFRKADLRARPICAQARVHMTFKVGRLTHYSN
jgi:hypothetical protein